MSSKAPSVPIGIYLARLDSLNSLFAEKLMSLSTLAEQITEVVEALEKEMVE